MTIDDPGWGGFIGEGDPDLADVPTSEQAPPAFDPAGPRTTPPRTAKPPPTGGGGRRGIPKPALIAVAALVLVGGGVGAAIALSSSKSPSTTTTTVAPGATGSTGSTGSTGTTGQTTTSSGTGGSEPAILGVVPSALSGVCTQTPTADRVSTAATDEVGCAAQTISGSSADLISFIRFPSSAVVSNYFSGLLQLNGLSANTGSCSNVTLSGSVSGGSFCEGTYTDSAGKSGSELIFVGSSFNVGGPAGSSSTFCSSTFPGSVGTTVVAWTVPSDDSVGFGVDCTDSTTSFAQGMQSNLVNDAFALND